MTSAAEDDARAGTRLTTLRLDGPADLLDLVPYVLGFQPASSLVLLALEPGPRAGRSSGRGRRLGAAARLDLSGIEQDPSSLDRALRTISRTAAAVVAVVYFDEPSVDPLPAAALIEELERLAADEGVELAEALLVRGPRWWSYLCADGRCCPPEGRLRPAGPTAAAAAAAYAGVSALPDRAALEATLDPAPLAAREAMRAPLAEAERRWTPADASRAKRALYTRVRQRSTEGALELMPLRPLPAPQIAQFGAALQDVSVRDACWLAMEAGRLPVSSLWIELARQLPSPYDAQPMFLHAWQAWRRGGGALAAMAAERALASDAGCTAAQLLLDSVAHGLDPRRTPRLRAGGKRRAPSVSGRAG